MSGEDKGEISKFEDLPEDISLEARKMFWEERPIRLFVFPKDVRVYVGKINRPDQSVAAATFKGGVYKGYNHDDDMVRLLQEITQLSEEIKLKTGQEQDPNLN